MSYEIIHQIEDYGIIIYQNYLLIILYYPSRGIELISSSTSYYQTDKMTISRKRLSINGRDKGMIRNRCSFHPAYFSLMGDRRRWHVRVVSHAHGCTAAAASQRSNPPCVGARWRWIVHSLTRLPRIFQGTTSSFYLLPLFALSTGNILYLTQHILSVYTNIKILGIEADVVH